MNAGTEGIYCVNLFAYLNEGTGNDCAGHSKLIVCFRGTDITSNLLPELTFGATLPTGSVFFFFNKIKLSEII